MSATVELRRAATAPLRSTRRAAGEQVLVAGGQLLSGFGNLVFAAAMARLLAPGGFAQLAAFLALFLLIAVPALSFSAGGAMDPELAERRRGAVLRMTLPLSLAIAAAGLALAPSLGLSPWTALALATTPTLVGLVELERGRLYGERAYGWVTASLVIEPLLRLGTGIALAAWLGAPGAAAGVVAGGLGALAAARFGRGIHIGGARAAARSGGGRRAARAAVLSFLFLAGVQCQDVVFANATLGGVEAARFAAISTLGGAAVFATATIPFVLMPRAQEGDPGALRAALGVAVALGGGAAAVAWIAPTPILDLAFGGGSYASPTALLGPYMLAMALLGVARVLAADAVVRGRRRVPWIVGAVSALQLGLLFAIGDSVAGVTTATLVATGALTAILAAEAALLHWRGPAIDAAVETVPEAATAAPTAELPAPPAVEPAPDAERSPGRRRRVGAGLLLLGMVAIGLALRLAASRSLWLDEATSWYEAELPYGRMIEVLRTTDVHPPLYFTVLWGTVRAFGDSELALRLPSLLAGVGLIPMLFVAGRALYDRRTGLVAAALGTLAPIAIWYSAEARMYAQVMLLAVVALWALHQAIATGRARYWAPYALAAAAMVWTHYFTLLPLLVFELAIGVAIWQRRRGPGRVLPLLLGGVAATLVIVALTTPVISFAHEQFMANQAAGKGFEQPTQAGGPADNQVSVYAALTNGIWAIWGYHSNPTMAALTALWPLLLLLCLMVLGRGRSRPTYLLLAATVVPTLMLTGLALGQPFLFELRYNITAVPFMLLLGARAITSWPHATVGRWALAGLAAATLAAGLADQQLNGANPRTYDFEGALSRISAQYRPGDVVLYRPNDLNNLVAYYAPDLTSRRLGERMPGRSAGRVFLLESFMSDPSNRAAIEAAIGKLSKQRRLVDQFSVPQVRVWEFQ